MEQTVQNFVDQNNKLAKKYNAKVSIGMPGEKEVVIADHTKDISGATNIVALESMINEEVKNGQRIKDLLRKQRDMYKDAFENDAEYHEQNEKLKALKKEIKATKDRIAQQPALFALKTEVSNLQYELRESKGKLSDLLLSYFEQTGSRQLELFDGEVAFVKRSAKLVKRTDR